LKSRSKGIAPSKAEVYREIFVTHVHILLWMGYSRLDRSTLPHLEEPEISGLICENIDAIFDDEDSPDWVVEYEIHDDPPVHDLNRKGKHRLRVDIKLISRRFRPRQRFCFEAKPLKTGTGVSKYLGKGGLGQFLDGSYSSDQDIGGMVAYVQTEDCEKWCSKISKKLNTASHKIVRGGTWSPVTVTDRLTHTYQTKHRRPGRLKSITVIHTLLDCTGR